MWRTYRAGVDVAPTPMPPNPKQIVEDSSTRPSTSSLSESEQRVTQSPTTTLSTPTDDRSLKTPPPPVTSSPATLALKPNPTYFNSSMQSIFEPANGASRPAPEMPSTENIEYPRAASWSSSTVAEIMRDPVGRQVFRVFLFESLAEENLLFVEQLDEVKKEKDVEKMREGVAHLMEKYGDYINISSPARAKILEFANTPGADKKLIEPAHKELSKLLENDQFPRFRRSSIYIGYLEKLMPREYAEQWSTSFDALVGNQVGRHHFRNFLFAIRAEENLRFWEAVIEYRHDKNKSAAMLTVARSIYDQFLRDGATNEIFLPLHSRQNIQTRIKEKNVDEELFSDAFKHIENILKNDPYLRFLESDDYKNLLKKLK